MNFKKLSQESKYWDNFYSDNYNKKILTIPSQFCCMVANEIDENKVVVEFGCGSGKDSFFLSKICKSVLAMDVSSVVIEKNNQKINDINYISFFCGDVSNEKDVELILKKAKSISLDGKIVLYSRFFIHSLDENQETLFLRYISKNLNEGDKLYFEFRTEQDLTKEKTFQNHYRRFINADLFYQKLLENGFEVIYFIEGIGMAKCKKEDPIIARFIAIKIDKGKS